MVKFNAGVSLRNSFKVADTSRKGREATRKGSGKQWFERSDSKQEYVTTDGPHGMQIVFFETSDDTPANEVPTEKDSTKYMLQVARTFPDDGDDDESDEKPKSVNVPMEIFETMCEKPTPDDDYAVTTFETISDKPTPKLDSVVSLFFETMDEDLKPIDVPVLYAEYSREQQTVPAQDDDEHQNKSRPTEDPVIYKSIDGNSKPEKGLVILETIEDTLIPEDDQAYRTKKKKPFFKKLAKILGKPRRKDDPVSFETIGEKPNSEEDYKEQLSLTSLYGDDKLVVETMKTNQETEAEEWTVKLATTELPTFPEVAETEAPIEATRHDADEFYEKPKHEADLFHDIIILQKLARQRAARNVAEQRRREQTVQSATAIQSAWRHYYMYTYSNYQCDLGNVIVAQNLVRRLAARNVAEQKHRQLMVQSATVIQTAWRGYYVYSNCHSDLRDIIIVQNHLRRRVARNIAEQKMHKQIVPSVTASIFRDEAILQYLERRLAARIVAKQKRRALMVRSATAIQTTWRGYDVCSSYHCYLRNIIIVQAAWRGYDTCWRYHCYLRKIIIVQALVRCRAARHVTELQRRERSLRSATAIQSAWRGYHACSRYQRNLRDITKVQSLVRRQAARNVTEQKRHHRVIQGATAVQTAWRCYYTCLRYQCDLRDIVMVQNLVRYQAARKIAEWKRRERIFQSAENLCRDIIILQYLERRLAAAERKRRERMIRSATAVQTAWRGYWSYHCDRRDIIIVQSHVRHQVACYVTEQKRRERTVQSATAIQTAWRGYYAFSRYQGDRRDVTMVQSIVRRQAARHLTEQKRRERIVRSATAIQTVWRGYFANSSYLCDLHDIMMVQSLARRQAARTTAEQKRLERIVTSATAIQTSWRGHNAYLGYQCYLRDIITVQNLVRRKGARSVAAQRRGERMIQSATSLQTAWRGYSTFSRYQCDLRNITLVQRLVRRQVARKVAEQKQWEQMIQSATAIQAMWIGYNACSRYRCNLRDVIMVQSLVRRKGAGNVVEQKRRERMIQSATAIQTTWRGYYTCSRYRYDLNDITIAQSLVRRLAARNVAEQKRRDRNFQSATAIETVWRGYHTYCSYQCDRRDIIMVQSLMRRQAARIVAEHMRRKRMVRYADILCRDIIVLQYLEHRLVAAEQKRHERKIRSATTIQTSWRGYYTRSRYQSDLRSIIFVQCLARRRAASHVTEQKRCERMVQSATRVQTAWRGYYTCSSYQYHLRDIILVQSLVRRQSATHVTEQKRCERMVHSATAAQNAWRGHNAYSRYQCELRNITLVQSLVRRQSARTIAGQKRREQMVESATAIQTSWRGYHANSSYQRVLRDLIILQSHVRFQAARTIAEQKRRERMVESATTFQTAWRRYYANSSYQWNVRNIIILQSHVRRQAARTVAEQKVLSATAIQTAWRGYYTHSSYQRFLSTIIIVQNLYVVARNVAQQKRRERMAKSATAVQTAWRGYKACLSYQCDLHGIIILQSFVRRLAARSVAEQKLRELLFHSATVIQTQWRAYNCSIKYLHNLADVLLAQSAVRRWRATKFVSVCRREVRDEAATNIQRTWRGFICYEEYTLTLAHIVVAQSRVQSWLADRKRAQLEQKWRERMVQVATAIQTAWRGYYTYSRYQCDIRDIIFVQSFARRLAARSDTERKRRQRMIHSATTIQTAWRGYCTCSRYQCDRRDIIMVQSLARRQSARNVAQQMRRQRMILSATAIQLTWRGYYTYTSYQCDLRDIIMVQSLVRRQAARNVAQQMRHQRVLQSATVIQSAWRCYYTRSTYQRDLRDIIMIQSLVRHQAAARNVTKKERREQLLQNVENLCRDIIILQYLEGRLAAAEQKRRKRKVRSATVIQASWRGYYERSSYQRDLRDLIAVQSFIRRQAARIVAEQKQRERTVQSATVIQSSWRGHYVCSCYQFDLRSIVIVQSLARRQAARKDAEQKLRQLMCRKKLPRAPLDFDSDDDSVTA
jgi:myosin heavy subunit